MALHTLDNGILRVSIESRGAELQSLVDSVGTELLWQGGAAWGRRAPVLFPIVGQMPGGVLEHDGIDYPISQHGFARDLDFTASEATDDRVLFTLEDSAETRTHFPFSFRLEIRYSLEGTTLSVETTVTNLGDETFSASVGEHPGFAWPLLPGIEREAHTLQFARDESAPIRRIFGGLLLPEPIATPVVGDTLHLDDGLFVDDAVIFDQLESRTVRYTAPGAPVITVDFPDFPLLGVWSKAPGEFVCIEPWFGMTAPQGFEGEYSAKPGQFTLVPGASRRFAYAVSVDSVE
ncbi:aldose 1-epimerase family protein [Lacisediminihabitans changchengi]|uniref:Aldose 1-epimerase family protein n=1 Tax=Lacisediminihabitans changchengi TaxID=2787634 RepID=A0A934SJD7_9MICO|nr:aldose 1-epimerase family protein [Lacisediminihabitans changchengi]MBK4346663.1 aldose 1-epimerase family protein [Lacisediminihabitans changchengi]